LYDFSTTLQEILLPAELGRETTDSSLCAYFAGRAKSKTSHPLSAGHFVPRG
jgi:hypothetical protein